VLGGPDVRVRLVRSGVAAVAEVAVADEPPPLAPSFTIVRAEESPWRAGRAGMRYRDLIPDRQGGRYIASHIAIPEGGAVADYVHFHAIRFQMIFCYRGWVRVVYEDQGEPFLMRAGDCVLQPPGIRHRVLEASPGLEVIELAMPAVHATHVDHERVLPGPAAGRDRTWSGQRFAHFAAGSAPYTPAAITGLERCDLGIAAATAGLASVSLLRIRHRERAAYCHDAELWFHVVLRGQLTIDDQHRLGAGDAFVIPAGRAFVWGDASPDLELLEVALPGAVTLRRAA
jgi:mannose-6-phosphate isomerase-like protein (cupin superfamily)